MARYTIGIASNTTATINAVRAELRSSSSDRLYVLEIGIFNGAATAGTIGLGRPAAIGVTPTSPKTLLAEDSASPAGTAQTAIAWGTAPTLPTDPLRRIGFPATIGAGVIWTFGAQGLLVPISSGLIIYNLTAAAAALDIYIEVDE